MYSTHQMVEQYNNNNSFLFFKTSMNLAFLKGLSILVATATAEITERSEISALHLRFLFFSLKCSTDIDMRTAVKGAFLLVGCSYIYQKTIFEVYFVGIQGLLPWKKLAAL